MGGYRYLFSQLVRRKYKGSSLGVLWYLINPLVLMGAYTLMFGHVFKLQHFPDFPIFLMIGLMAWTFFAQSLLAAADSAIGPALAQFPGQEPPCMKDFMPLRNDAEKKAMAIRAEVLTRANSLSRAIQTTNVSHIQTTVPR